MRSPFRIRAAVAREVVEAYGHDIGAHPVGTGPVHAGRVQAQRQIELVANPAYRDVTYVPAGPIPPASQAVAAALKGKRLPLAPRIEISIIEEGQARWLAFLNGELDLLESAAARLHRPGARRRQAEARARRQGHPARGAAAAQHVAGRTSTWRTRVVGGYTPEKIALRRAIGMAYDVDEADPRAADSGRAHSGERARSRRTSRATTPRSRPTRSCTIRRQRARCSTSSATRIATATAIARRPDGKPLVIERWSAPTSADARRATSCGRRTWTRSASASMFKKDKLPELRKMARQGKIPMRERRLERRLSGRREFHAAALRAQSGQENNAQLQPAGIQQALRARRASCPIRRSARACSTG